MTARNVLLVALAALIVAGPLAFGGTHPWSRAGVHVLAALISFAWALSRPRATRLLWIPAAVMGVGILQLVPLPKVVLAGISPLASRADAELGDLGLERVAGCVCLCPGSTVDDLCDGFLTAMLLVVVADVARDPRVRQALAGSLIIAGGMVFFLAVACFITGNKQGWILGFHEVQGRIKHYKNPLLDPRHSAGFGYPDAVEVGGVTYSADAWNVGDAVGPFATSNQFAGFMNLTMPLGLAVVLAKPPPSRGARAAFLAAVGLASVAALFAVGTLAGSRGGTVSLAVGLLLAAGLTARRVSYRRVCLGLAGVAFTLCIVGLVWLCSLDIGQGSAAGSPARPRPWLRELAGAVQGRAGAWHTAADMLRHSPWLGTGLGTFGKLFAAFAKRPAVWYYAHNDYIQLAAETGVVGCGVAAGAVVLMMRQVVAKWPRISDSPQRYLAAGIVASLAAFLTHELLEWNLHVPACAVTFVVLAGTLVAMAASEPALSARPAQGQGAAMCGYVARCALTLAAVACASVTLVEVTAHEMLMPLRRAVVQERLQAVAASGARNGLPAVEASDAHKKRPLADAMPGALAAARLAPWSDQPAREIAKAYLHLSAGRLGPELRDAERWFQRAIRLCPLNYADRATLAEIYRRLDTL